MKHIPIELLIESERIHEVMESKKWAKEIPFIQWPPGWEVKAVPAFGGAVIRYRVREVGMTEDISIYLDCYDRLGLWGSPYWEAYSIDGDTFRCDMLKTDELLEALRAEFERRNHEKENPKTPAPADSDPRP